MSLESGISSWLHKTYTDVDHLFTAASAVMTDPVSVGGTLYSLSEMSHDVWEVAWDTTTPGFLQAFLQGLTGNSPAAFSTQWPLVNTNLTIGGYYDMAVLVIPNVYRCTIQATVSGRQVVNVIGVQGSSAGQQATVCAALKTAWEIANGPAQSLASAYVLAQYTVMDLSTTSGGIAQLTSSKAGSAAGSPSTRAASAIIKWNGGSRSRSTRGRLYYGPVSTAQLNSDGATLSSAAITLFNTAFTAFMNSLTGAGFPLVVMSRKNASAVAVTTFTVEQQIGTQRRRLRS